MQCERNQKNEKPENIKIKVLDVCIIITWTWVTPSTDTFSTAPFVVAILLKSLAIFQSVDNKKEQWQDQDIAGNEEAILEV